MSICKPDIFFSKIKKGGKLLSIDYGNKFVGLAISDERLKISNPFDTIRRKNFKFLVENIVKVITKENIVGIILGWPINMDGTEGPRCDATRDFSHAFIKIYEIPICFHDERLSTNEAKNLLDKVKAPKNKVKILTNSLAASFILQDFLDIKNYNNKYFEI